MSVMFMFGWLSAQLYEYIQVQKPKEDQEMQFEE